MSDHRKKSVEPRTKFLRDAFEGMNGRQPTSDNELKKWLATDEGKEATLFDDTTISPWGERGDRRSRGAKLSTKSAGNCCIRAVTK